MSPEDEAMTVPIAETIAIEGAIITCPRCHARIGVLRKALRQGWRFGLDAIRFEQGQSPLDNQAACRLCGTAYAELDIHATRGQRTQTMLVHTNFGWLPKDPPNVAAQKR